MACVNPYCRHRTKRRLRPLVISLDEGGSSIPNPSGKASKVCNGNGSRRDEITYMFASHPSLAAHFEPPQFSPGVPSRDLRNRLGLLEHANRAGLIPDVEWEGICMAVRDDEPEGGNNHAMVGLVDDCNHDDGTSSPLLAGNKGCSKGTNSDSRHKVIDPFRYLATTTKIQQRDDDGKRSSDETKLKSETKRTNKNNRWHDYHTTSLVPISSQRRGSAEDKSLPYSVELWRKAKGLNRDRSVLACALAHLRAMKMLVEGSENDSLNDSEGGGGRFDFILEDNVRAFVGAGGSEGRLGEMAVRWEKKEVDHWTGWSCECANRIWDTIEASNESPGVCHMRYYGWLGSSPNLTWIYKKHIPRSMLNHICGYTGRDSHADHGVTEFAEILPSQNSALAEKCAPTIFPFPTNEDFILDLIDAASKSAIKKFETTNFEKPGGTAIWGAFAYTISPAAYSTLINHLRNDVGSLLWKGKRMRAHHAKPIDKILPRHIRAEFGQGSVHIPDRVAFVRGPMLGSLLHPKWEEGFCTSTEIQYMLSCSREGLRSNVSTSCNDIECCDVWDHVWLTEAERQVTNHRKKSGKWISKADIEKSMSISGK